MKSNFDRILSSEDVMRRRATLLQRLHIDGPLLVLLLTLAAGSLFVLYSASGKSWDLLAKQATSFGIGLVSMIVIAQFEPRFMARWVPLGYVHVADFSQLDENHIAQGFLSVVANTYGHAAVGFQAGPFVTVGKTQVGRDIAHVLCPQEEVSAAQCLLEIVRSGFCRGARRSV